MTDERIRDLAEEIVIAVLSAAGEVEVMREPREPVPRKSIETMLRMRFEGVIRRAVAP